MKVDTNTLNEIRSNIDIVEIISSYIPLVSKGKNFFGVCPFHDDHSPSMSVSHEKQIYTCFSCGASGNAFKFVQDYENISFLEAVQKCSVKAGISIDIGHSYKEDNRFQYLYDIYSLSLKYYQNNINTEYGKKAKEYLYNRELTDEVIKEFGIGLSFNEKNSLTKLLQSKKYSEKELIKSGLINENEFALNDIYRNRIMFPLQDLNGQVIGYNGRVYNGEVENKYINSKETDIFKKSNYLYNYHRAKDECRKQKSVIIMEGPLDVIRAYTVGVKNCVATLGTAFTKEHAMLIRKLSNNVILCFDGDEAGLKATKTAITELTKLGIEPKIVRLDNNSDPDEYIIKNGVETFNNKIKTALNLVEFKDIILKSQYNLNNTIDMSKYINEMINQINLIEDDILREISINKLCDEVNIDKNIIMKKINNKEKIEITVKNTVKIRMNKYQKSERNLIFYMLLNKEVIKMYEKKITRMPTKEYRHIAFQIDCFYKQNGYINVADFITYLNSEQELINIVGQIISLDLSENIDFEIIEDYLNNIREYNEKEQIILYKQKLKDESEYKKKIELANKALEVKRRREEND